MKKSFIVVLLIAVAVFVVSMMVKETQEPVVFENSTAWCDNAEEVQTFQQPIPIIWTAKFGGCLVSCQGASFMRVPADEKYPAFAAYYPDKNGGYFTEEFNPIPEEFQDSNLLLKITGDWTEITEDHPQTVFGGKCVPIVNIKEIDVVE